MFREILFVYGICNADGKCYFICDIAGEGSLFRKEEHVLFNDALNTFLFTVIWRQFSVQKQFLSSCPWEQVLHKTVWYVLSCLGFGEY